MAADFSGPGPACHGYSRRQARGSWRKMPMSIAKLAWALLATTALVGAGVALACGSEADHTTGAMESHDRASMPAQPGGGHKHHTEALDSGLQAAAAEATAQPTKPPPLWDNLGTLTWKVTT